MFLFKTSGRTLGSVVANQKHAFRGKPSLWDRDEIVLISKNRQDCALGEKQIQYVARLATIRPLRAGEAELLWPGNEGRWKYLVNFRHTRRLVHPFDLQEVLGRDAEVYGRGLIAFARVAPDHDRRIREFLSAREPEILA
jgi:hypothetical protein